MEKENKMITCPACSGPTALGGGCATCNGTTQVTQETLDAFEVSQTKLDAANEFWSNIQSFMNQPGTFKFEANGEITELVAE